MRIQSLVHRVWLARQARRRTTQVPARKPHLRLEALEERWVPATIAIDASKVLTYTAGASITNKLTISLEGATYKFNDTSEAISAPGFVGTGTKEVKIPASKVASMVIKLGDRDDSLGVNSSSHSIAVKAGAGNDVVEVGKTGGLAKVLAPVSVDGEGGADGVRINDSMSTTARTYTLNSSAVTSSGARDVSYSATEAVEVTAGGLGDTFRLRSASGLKATLNGGGGADLFRVEPSLTAGAVTIDGQGGIDTLDYSAFAASAPVKVDLALGTATSLSRVLGIENATGGAGNDTVVGNDLANVLSGGAGNDKLSGGAGNDKLFGGAGVDQLFGDAGDDWLDAGSASETATGGAGTDWNARVWVTNGYSRQDIHQTGSGTCVFLSSLAAAAHRGIDLTDRISYLGNFVYRVKLFDPAAGGWVNEDVTFDGGMVKASGSLMDPASQAEGEFWTIVYQRAYLQHFENIDPMNGTAVAAFDGETNGNRSLTAITGRTATTSTTLNAATMRQQLQAGAMMNAGGTGHRYAVLDVFQVNGAWRVKLYNPWGSDASHTPNNGAGKIVFDADGSNDGVITIDWKEFTAKFKNYSRTT